MKMFFLTKTSGHHLEYLHHIHENLGQKQNGNYIFLVPKEFNNLKNKFVWGNYDNISIRFFKESDLKRIGKNKFLKSYYLSLCLRKYMNIFNVKDVFLINLMSFLPFLPFFIKTNSNISGIIYQIYLYKWNSSSIINKAKDVFKYYLFTKFSCFSSVFLLNDDFAYKYLNKKYKTNKFNYLVDPVAVIDESEPINLRSSLNFLKQDQIILHFGAMTKSKGTIDILDLLGTIPKNNLDNLLFIFAGVVKKDIIDIFTEKTNQLSYKVRIIIYNDFLEYSFINSLFYTSDVILCPYNRVYQSSGVIGLSAKFNKPVIVPNKGFLGKLVKRNKIGFTYNNLNEEEFLNLVKKSKFFRASDKYVSSHNIENFSNQILSLF